MSGNLTLVLMAGLPGAGKSTLATALGRATGWPVLDKDTFKSALLRLGVPEATAGPASYELLMALAKDLLVGQRLSVILDSPAAYRIVAERAIDAAGGAGAALRVVLCLAGQDLRAARLSTRTPQPSQPAVIEPGLEGDGRGRFLHLPPGTLAVDTTRPVDDVLPGVLAYVRGNGSVSGPRGRTAPPPPRP